MTKKKIKMEQDAPLFTATSLPASSEQLDYQPGQWRLAQLQVLNWGTFDKHIHTVNIGRKGFVLSGKSGTGKSSLLDAISAVLIPDRWQKFNAAAGNDFGGPRKRSLVSYVRGAYSEGAEEDSTRIEPKYLRRNATWSAILLRYEDGKSRSVTIMRLFLIKGQSTAHKHLNDLRIIIESSIENRYSISDFSKYSRGGAAGIDTRRIKNDWPNATITSGFDHQEFFIKIKKIFGMRDDTTLQLLHKTQSARNINSLNKLLRDFMLDVPETFKQAENFKNEFQGLQQSYIKVVTLREQKELLERLADQAHLYENSLKEINNLHRLSENLESFHIYELLALNKKEKSRLENTQNQRASALKTVESALATLDDQLTEAKLERSSKGGDSIASLEKEINLTRSELKRCEQRLYDFYQDIDEAEIRVKPKNAEELINLQTQIRAELSELDANQPRKEELQKLGGQIINSKNKLTYLRKQADALKHGYVTLPGELLELRHHLAVHLGVKDEILLFGAEIMRVKSQYQDWTGAIERVLRPLALTLLVPENYINSVADWVDRRNLGVKLTYRSVPKTAAGKPYQVPDTTLLAARIEITNRDLSGWMLLQIAKSYDYVCVDSTEQFSANEKARTKNGQIKRGPGRFEKDDRFAVTDKSRWLLGDSKERLEETLVTIKSHEHLLSSYQKEYDQLNQESQNRAVLRKLREKLLKIQWESVDTTIYQSRLINLERKLNQAEGALPELAPIQERIESLEKALNETRNKHQLILVEKAKIEQQIEELTKEITDSEEQIKSGEITALDSQSSDELRRLFVSESGTRSLSKQTIRHYSQIVRKKLQRQEETHNRQANIASENILRLENEFVSRWPNKSSELVTKVDARNDFLQILNQIVRTGLPETESRFAALLKDRSFKLVGDLRRSIMDAFNEVKERIEPINESLLKSEFDRGVYLQLIPIREQSEIVKEFLQDLAFITQNSVGADYERDNSDETEFESAEKRYLIIEKLMKRFCSEEKEDKDWYTECLDTRSQVKFVSQEIDSNGVELARRDSGSAMSGGQQQKLTVFCLAAALRYKLANVDDQFPSYGSIILDEAFDKADSEYTKMALEIFRQFGFHMLMATPERNIPTFEPYVDSMCIVANEDRTSSSVQNVYYSPVTQSELES